MTHSPNMWKAAFTPAPSACPCPVSSALEECISWSSPLSSQRVSKPGLHRGLYCHLLLTVCLLLPLLLSVPQSRHLADVPTIPTPANCFLPAKAPLGPSSCSCFCFPTGFPFYCHQELLLKVLDNTLIFGYCHE